jgi:hypothetical protein
MLRPFLVLKNTLRRAAGIGPDIWEGNMVGQEENNLHIHCYEHLTCYRSINLKRNMLIPYFATSRYFLWCLHTFAWRYWGRPREACVRPADNLSEIRINIAYVYQRLQINGVLLPTSYFSLFRYLTTLSVPLLHTAECEDAWTWWDLEGKSRGLVEALSKQMAG